VSLQIQVLARVDAKKYKEELQKGVDWLMAKAIRKNNALAGWSYPANEFADGSNTHFAVMGLHAAEKAGAKVDEKLWKQIENWYVRNQLKEGWSYYDKTTLPGDPATRTMTTCGLIGLLIASKHDKEAKGPNEAFEKGLKVWVPWDLQSPKSVGYAMMAVAELGRLHGSNEFRSGDKTWNWYRIGAERVIKSQKEDGSLVEEMNKPFDANPVLATAFRLYFLGPPAKKQP
jgi:hypothetical protein